MKGILTILFLFLLADTFGQNQHINIDSVAWSGYKPYHMVYTLSRDSLVKYLFNNTAVDTLHTPTGTFLWNQSVNQTLYAPFIYVVQFFQTETLQSVQWYDGGSTDYFTVYYATTPGSWTQLDSVNTGSFDQWNPMRPTGTVTFKFLKFVLNSQLAKVNQVLVYATPSGTPMLTTPPAITRPIHTMLNSKGVNMDGNLPYYFPQGLVKHVRYYDDIAWQDTNTVNKPLTSLNYVYDVYSHNPNPAVVQFPLSSSSVVSYALPNYLYDSNYSKFQSVSGMDLIYAEEGFPTRFSGYYPIDSTQHPNGNPQVPSSYDAMGQYFYKLAQQTGFGNDGSLSNITFPGYVNGGFTHYQEECNENNLIRLYTGGPLINSIAEGAYLSEIWDGNGGSLHSGIGVHNADPSTVLIQGGMGYPDSAWMDGILYENTFFRTDSTLVFYNNGGVLNYHYYNSNFGSPIGYALSPEQGQERIVQTQVVNKLHTYCWSCQVWKTEGAGYSSVRGTNSPYGLPYITGVDSTFLLGEWQQRADLADAFTGLDRFYTFQMQNDPGAASATNEAALNTIFGATGFTTYFYNGSLPATQFLAKKNYFMMIGMMSIIGNYMHDSIVYEHTQTTDSIFQYRFRDTLHTDSICQVVWCGTQTNHTASFTVKVGSSGQVVTVLNPSGTSTTPTSSNMTANSSGNITITASENPTYILTTDNYSPTPPTNVNGVIIRRGHYNKFITQ